MICLNVAARARRMRDIVMSLESGKVCRIPKEENDAHISGVKISLSAITAVLLIVTLHTNVASSIGAEILYSVTTKCECQFHHTNLILI